MARTTWKRLLHPFSRWDRHRANASRQTTIPDCRLPQRCPTQMSLSFRQRPPSHPIRGGKCPSASGSARHPIPSVAGLALLPRLLAMVMAELDPSQRLVQLQALLHRLAGLSALELSLALQEVQRATGISASILRKSLPDLRRERLRRPAPAQSNSLPVLEVMRGEDTLSTVFQRLIDRLLPLERFYVRAGALVYLQPGSSPLPITESNLPGLLSANLEVRMLQRVDGRVDVVGYEPLPTSLARTFVNSPRVRELLPPLATWAQAPAFTADWRFTSRRGYHAGNGGIYYDGPELTPRPGCTTALETLLRGTPWAASTDKVHFIGALITALTMTHWTTGHPVVAINANKEGSGKSTLAQALGMVMEGRKTRSITFEPYDTEFEKQIATRVEQGERFICVDNVKLRRPVESAVLERTVTDFSPNFRRLGSNSAISREHNDLFFCLTMNDTLLGPDMRVRSLPINLRLSEGAHPAGGLRDPKRWLLDHWTDLVEEVAGMVMYWLDAGRPEGSGRVRHSTSNTWAGTIDGILRINGFEGFLSNYEASMRAFDRDYVLMLEACRAFASTGAKTASEWAQLLSSGSLEERSGELWGRPRSSHARTILVTKLFAGMLKTPFEVDGVRYRLLRREPRGPTHSPLYSFEPDPSFEPDGPGRIDSMAPSSGDVPSSLAFESQ